MALVDDEYLQLEFNKIVNFIEKEDMPPNTVSLQFTVLKYIKTLETILEKISKDGLFSNNEKFNEIDPKNLKYLLVSAFIGILHSYLNTKRAEHLRLAHIFYQGFLKICTDYQVPLEKFDLLDNRSKKIAQYQAKQKLIEEVKQMKFLNTKRYNENEYNEYQKKYYTLFINKYYLQISDDINLIHDEISLIKSKTSEEEKNKIKDDEPLQAKMRNDREIMKAKVYGKGYPSLPIQTPEEWYIERFENNGASDNPQKYISEEVNSSDDDSKIQEKRNLDDWKDSNPRGWGNTYNKS